MGDHYLSIIFSIIALNQTTIENLCKSINRDRETINLLLSILNAKMDIAFSGLKHHMNICLLSEDIVTLALYPTNLLNKFIKIKSVYRIEEIFNNISNNYYMANKLLDSDIRPMYYYAHDYNRQDKDKFIEMFTLSMGVALISFLFGLLIRNFFGVEI